MEGKNEVTIQEVETLGLDKKYFQIQPQEGESAAQFMVRKLRELGIEPKDVVVRRFSNKRVLDALFIGTDRVSGGIINFQERRMPSLSRHGPRYEYQEELMKKHKLSNDQVLWGLPVSSESPEEIFEHLYKNSAEDAISIYRKGDLRPLVQSSFWTFRGNSQQALIAVFANQALTKLPKK